MAHRTDRHIMEVHQLLHTFYLSVLAYLKPTVDLKTLQAAMGSLREDMDAIMEARVP